MLGNGEITESIVIVDNEDVLKKGMNTSKSKEVYFFLQILHKNPSNAVRSSSKSSTTSTTKRSTKSKKTSKTNVKTKKNNTSKRFQPLLEENLLTMTQ